VEIARVENLLRDRTSSELACLFTAPELADAGTGAGRAASLAARFAAKEACLKLFPRETALGMIHAADFGIRRNAYGEPMVEVSPIAQAVLDRHRIASLRVSLTHTDTAASAIVWADPQETDTPWFGKLLYHVMPYRRNVVLGNLQRVFGDVLPETEIRRLAQAYYAHFARFLVEIARLPLMSSKRRQAWVRVENKELAISAHAQGKGLFLLTGHFGNFEVSTVAGIEQFPRYRGKFHFIRRLLKPQFLNQFVTWRFHRAGFGTLSKRGSLDAIFDVLRQGGIVVYVMDQHAGGHDGVEVDFLGHPAGTFKSLAILAMDTGAPVVPVSSWREPDGTHVIRFEEPLPVIECDDGSEAIRRNTRAYNAALERMLLRHPEQWIWMHRRWKLGARTQRGKERGLERNPTASRPSA
jgi:KDO2-lipid IV(A) lauroyltransferase